MFCRYEESLGQIPASCNVSELFFFDTRIIAALRNAQPDWLLSKHAARPLVKRLWQNHFNYLKYMPYLKQIGRFFRIGGVNAEQKSAEERAEKIWCSAAKKLNLYRYSFSVWTKL